MVGDINYSIRNLKSFNYKINITGKLEFTNTAKNAEIAVPLKYLSNFWRRLDMPLINCEVSLTLTCSEICIFTTAVDAINNPANGTLAITEKKLYIPVVTLSTQDDNKLLENLKKGFKRSLNGVSTDWKHLLKLKILMEFVENNKK